MRRRPPPAEIMFALVCLAMAVPLWITAWVPLQDLPQHLAAIRVIHDYSDPALSFDRYFVLELGRTQYLSYYLAAHLLAYVFSVELAQLILLTIVIVATPYAMRALLSALGRDGRLALALAGLTWNAHLFIGFLNFIAAIPLMLWGLALAIQLRRRWTRGRAVLLVVVTVVCFYTHVIPFGLLGLGAALVLAGDSLLATIKRWLLLLPASVAMGVWAFDSPAGQSVGAALQTRVADRKASFQPFKVALREVPGWLTDIVQNRIDTWLLLGWVALLVCGAGYALANRGRQEARAVVPPDRTFAWRLSPLVALSIVAYFVLPTGYDWMWPISPRFALLTPIVLLPVLPAPSGRWLQASIAGFALIAVASAANVSTAFKKFESEVGDFDGALAHIPTGQRVVALMFDRGSRYVRFWPFLHTAGLVQLEKGGAVMFTFATFPQSPFRYRYDVGPPPVPRMWEWFPNRVDPRADLGWYDYVLVRGGPGLIASQKDAFDQVFVHPPWSLWQRRK